MLPAMAQPLPSPAPVPPGRSPGTMGSPVERYLLADDGTFPNHRWPLLVYRAAVSGGDPDALQARFAAHDWTGAWRNGIYSFHHYHSTSHEVLGCYAGEASVRLGGPTNRGITATVRAGDVLVIPAGVAHCNLGASADFAVLGAYPEGRRWDLLRGARGERPAADARIAALPRPAQDPVHGAAGPLGEFWK